ncbi:MAG: glycosyltransferase family 2 protein, partial [Bacteroidetes bacterium]|nr:glycosyltransferase family 2 protein [Bacteroidota bacterium]
LLFNKIKGDEKIKVIGLSEPIDYAVIITAYEETYHIPQVVASILKQDYQNFFIYIVADKCDITNLKFDDERVFVIKPDVVIGSNTGSHQFAINHFKRPHTHLTIIDSDNVLRIDYLKELNIFFNAGYVAIQGKRAAKNLNTTYACLDAARDIYYHFYDGVILFNIGSSATLAGSGMGFETQLYSSFLQQNKVSGAGFDKVLQAWILNQNIRIAFNDKAIIYDEKTTKPDQLVKQRSRWINTWFKYFTYGFKILFKGFTNLSFNQIIFGVVLLRPPLFIFLILSVFAVVINLIFGLTITVWLLGFISFIISFFLALAFSETDRKIYSSLINIPKFVFYQLLSLLKVRKANQISVATKHYHGSNHETSDIKNYTDESRS